MPAFRAVLFCAALAAALPCGAQTTYRWIDKTGQTVFSDQPPPPDVRVIETRQGRGQEDEQPLPYATRQAAEKYPVVLYTTANCTEICASARALLNGRGVPFAERMLASPKDIEDFSKRFGESAGIPSLSVGQQTVSGLENGAWNNLLDLAGYPKTAPYGSKPSGTFTP